MCLVLISYLSVAVHGHGLALHSTTPSLSKQSVANYKVLYKLELGCCNPEWSDRHAVPFTLDCVCSLLTRAARTLEKNKSIAAKIIRRQ